MATVEKKKKGLRSAAALEESRPPWRPTPGSLESGDRTRINILWAAQRVLATKGYAGFTTRAVAAAAGIKAGNVTYHYKTKRDLLRAVITAMVKEYARQMEEFFYKASREPREGFPDLVAWLIHDSTTPSTARLFRELWVMALHDPFAAEAIDGFYDQSFARITEWLRASYPGLGQGKARDIVNLLGMMCEGANPIYGTSEQSRASVTRVTRLAIEALVRAAQDEASKG